MSSLEFWIGLLLAVVMLLSTTANAAIRQFSRVRLAERLEPRGRGGQVAELCDRQSELLFVTSFVRMCAILGMVLLVTHEFMLPEVTSGASPSGLVGPYALVFVTSVVLIMLFGVAIPHAWARYDGTRFLASTLPVWFGLRRVLLPLAACQRGVDWLVKRLAGVPDEDEPQTEAEEIEKEILGVVSEGEAAGAVHEDDADMIESVIKFRDTNVAEIMTPRTEIVALPSNATLMEAKELIARAGHSRIPVYEENLDDIKGVLYAKDLLNLSELDQFDPLEMMRKVPFVPESKRICDLLRELREQKVHLAIVLDEYGGTAGLVTIEDILEEIVGEIEDEYETPEPEPIRRIDPFTVEVDARMRIDRLNQELDLGLPEDRDYDTLGGFVFSALGRIPEPGAELCYQNLRLRVIDAEERRINRVRVELAAGTKQDLPRASA